MFILINVDTAQLQNNSQLRLASDRQYFYVHNDAGAIQVQLRKRQSRPRTFCQRIGEGTFRLGYETDTSRQLGSEFLDVVVTSTGDVQISRDIFCTLPLYFAYQAGRLVISNLYAAVAAQLTQLTLDRGTLNVHLAGRTLPDRRNLYQEIHTLEEQAILTLQHGVLQHTLGPPRPERSSLDVPAADPHEFLPMLEDAFERLINNRIAGNKIAFEISGGLDSSTLPLYIGKKYPGTRLYGVTMRLPGEHRQSQEQKIHALQSAANLQVLGQDLETGRNSPLQRVMRGQELVMHPIPSPTEVYYEPTDYFARLLRRENVDTIVTGIGGDELFEHIVDAQQYLGIGDEVYQDYARDAPPYVTAAHMEAAGHALRGRQLPLPQLSAMLHGASVYRNNTYIEHDIWPVSPFADPYLVRFCQGLPSHFKANKNILRAFYQAHGFPDELYNSQNEDFDSFFEEAFYAHSYDGLFYYLLERSWSSALGYIDTARLRGAYERAIKYKDSKWLFCLYCWMCTEVDMMYHQDKIHR